MSSDDRLPLLIDMMHKLGPVQFHRDVDGAVERLERHREYTAPDDHEFHSEARCRQDILEAFRRWNAGQRSADDAGLVLYYQYHHWVFHYAALMPDELDELGVSQQLGNLAFWPLWRMNFPIFPAWRMQMPNGLQLAEAEIHRMQTGWRFLADPLMEGVHRAPFLEVQGFFGVYDVQLVDRRQLRRRPV